MRKLSQRAWNNVLIFTVLFLILLFNLDQFSSTEEPTEGRPFSASDHIVSLEIDLLTFERVGTAWRVIGPEAMISEDLSAEKISQFVDNWQSMQLSEIQNVNAEEALSRPEHIVQVFVAGKDGALTIYLSRHEGVLYALINQQSYRVDSPGIFDLIPVRAMPENA